MFPTKECERTRTEVLIETFIRKQLRLKAHTVSKVEETDELAAGARLVLEGILPTILDLQTALACRAASAQVDELGDALEVGAVQKVRGHASISPGWGPRLDQNPAFERSR